MAVDYKARLEAAQAELKKKNARQAPAVDYKARLEAAQAELKRGVPQVTTDYSRGAAIIKRPEVVSGAQSATDFGHGTTVATQSPEFKTPLQYKEKKYLGDYGLQSSVPWIQAALDAGRRKRQAERERLSAQGTSFAKPIETQPLRATPRDNDEAVGMRSRAIQTAKLDEQIAALENQLNNIYSAPIDKPSGSSAKLHDMEDELDKLLKERNRIHKIDNPPYNPLAAGRDTVGSAVHNFGTWLEGAELQAGVNAANAYGTAAVNPWTQYASPEARDFIQRDTRAAVEETLSGDTFGSKVSRAGESLLAPDAEGAVGKALQSTARAVGGMLPTIAIGGPAGLIYMGQSVAGSSAKEAFNQGAELESAYTRGQLTGAKEVLTEAMFGGIARLGGGAVNKLLSQSSGAKLRSVVSQIADRLPNGVRSVIGTVTDTLGEGAEEIIAGVLQPYIDRLTYNPDADLYTMDAAVQDALIGSLVSAVLGVAPQVGRAVGSRVTSGRTNANAPQIAQYQKLYPNKHRTLLWQRRAFLPYRPQSPKS